MTSKPREFFLDLLRGCAALLVCANHLRSVSIVGYQSLPDSNVLLQAFYFVTGLGHQAVIVFFVLSGYFVGGSLLAKGAAFSWREYGIARLTRLWVVLIPALLLTAACDQIMRLSAPDVLAGGFAAQWHLGPQSGGDYSMGAEIFLGNLLFLQQIFLPVYGSNDPLWSLAYEFWYYIAFPLLLIGCGRRLGSYGVLLRCLALIATTTILICLPLSGRVGFLCWLGGAAVYAFGARFRLLRVPVPLALMIFVGGLVLSRWMGKGNASAIAVDMEMALFTIVLLAAVASKTRTVSLGRPLSWVAFHLSEMSYSLYLIHFPLVLCIGGIALRGRPFVPDAGGLMTYLGLLCALLALAWCFWFVFERRTNQIRTALQQVLAGRPS